MSDTRPSWDQYFLGFAQQASTRADCTRRQVGAVVVSYSSGLGRIIGTGYNGSASGTPGCASAGACPRGRRSTTEVAPLGDYDRPGSDSFCNAIHAEANALLFSIASTVDSVVYITDPPCPSCRKLLAAAGVARVVWPSGEMTRIQLVDFTSD